MSPRGEYERLEREAVERLDVLDRVDCSAPRCRALAVYTLTGAFGDRDFCRTHAVKWRRHNALVERIRTLR